MTKKKMPNGYWENKENCKEKCSECKGLKELRKKSYACYLSVKKHGWDTEFFEVKQKPMGYWNDKEHCMEEAKKYRTVRELQLASDSCYASLKRNGWLLEAYPPKNGSKPMKYWNLKENVMEAAKQCNTKMEFRTKFGGAFMSAVRNGWMPEIENEFVSGQTSRKIWTYDKCKEFCKNYKYKSELQKANSQCYDECLKNGWFGEFGIVNKKRPNGYWKSLDNCIAAAKECKDSKEFRMIHSGAYISCRANGWMDKINEVFHITKHSSNINKHSFTPNNNAMSEVGTDGNNKVKAIIKPTQTEKKDFIVRPLSDEDKKKIINEYKTNSIANICKKWHISDRRAKQILLDNGVTIRKTNQATVASNDYNEQNAARYPHVDGKKYVAVLRSDESVVFDDYLNKSGTLIAYIKKNLLITPPSLFKRKKYFFDHGKQWYEMFFDIRLVNDNSITKKCPYCGWETTDVDNKSGAYMNHITIEHNMTPEEHLKLHPEDKIFFKRVVHEKEKQKLYSDPHNYVVCPICGKKFQRLSLTHFKYVHHVDYYQWMREHKYGPSDTMSDLMNEKAAKAQHEAIKYAINPKSHSKDENEIKEFIESLGFTCKSNRTILDGKEIDILVEDKKIGFEYNGLYTHMERPEEKSEFLRKGQYYHLTKTRMANNRGYKLVHIFENEFHFKKDIVFSKIKQLLGKNEGLPKVYARKCNIKEINKTTAEVFLNHFHIQGFCSSSTYIGAFYEDKLVGVMSFKNRGGGEIELNRFATDYNFHCIGLGGKLFNYYIKNYNPSYIVTFADRRWTVDVDNNLYTKIGFTKDAELPPDYVYYNGKVDKYNVFNKRGFRKNILVSRYPDLLNMNMTESEMTEKLGYSKIWNCGLIRYVWLNPE